MFRYCEGCLEKQTKIEHLQDENRQLKARLRYHERKSEEGYFGLSTPSSKVPFKAGADEVIKVDKGSACPECGDTLRVKKIRERTVIESVFKDILDKLAINPKANIASLILQFMNSPPIVKVTVPRNFLRQVSFQCQ